MSALRVLIADDEETARRRLRRLLGAMDGVDIVGECATGAEVLARVRYRGVDVLLLDIEMPGLSGLDALGLLPPGGPEVVFCTAHTSHAVAAFDAGVADYVLKPIEAARLHRAIERARARLEARASPRRSGAAAGAGARLPIPTRQGILLVDAGEISHATLADGLVTIHTTTGQLLTDSSLQDLEARLRDLGSFERVHRRTILNLEHVVRLEPLDSGGLRARTRSGEAIQVSRQAARALRRRWGLARGGDDS